MDNRTNPQGHPVGSLVRPNRGNSQAQFRYSYEMHRKNKCGETCLYGVDFRFAYASAVTYLLESAARLAGEWVNVGTWRHAGRAVEDL